MHTLKTLCRRHGSTVGLAAAMLMSLYSVLAQAQTALPLSPPPERARQVHLDFHTSEHIDSIGVDFSRAQFRQALRTGHVDAINVFAKGHHSWFYYPTEIGRQHPGLDFDLLGEMVEACRAEDVKVYAYFTVGWSANDAIAHPEWVALERDGKNPFREQAAELDGAHPGGWEYLEPSGPYADTIYAQLEELVSSYDLDGVWFDIFKPHLGNYNAWSLQDFAARGIDTADLAAVDARVHERYAEFMQRCNAIIAEHLPEASAYYNGTTATYTDRNVASFKYGLFRYNTKHDLEDLPTAWGGYDIFPWRSKYFAATGKDIVAMSGKFHKAWGEFGGFKDAAAIKYEAATMVSFGAACNFGDQLHPKGEMDADTYANIGEAYAYVKEIEDYGVHAEHTARLGLYASENIASIEGATRMLVEEQRNFHVVNLLEDWSDFEVVVVTSGGVLPRDRTKVKAFVDGGGKVLVMGAGAIVEGEPFFDIGADYVGPADFDGDYTVVGDELATDMVRSPYLNYAPGIRLSPKPGTRVLAGVREPYFSRTLTHYSSHNNTPYRTEPAAHPAVIERADGRVIAIAHDIDRQYFDEGMRLHRQLFENALQRLDYAAMVEADMPSMGRLNLLHQPEAERYVGHLTYASPIQRGNVRVVEDIVPLHDVAVRFRLPAGVEATDVYAVPGKQALTPRALPGGGFEVVLPKLDMHAAVVVEYER